MLIVNGIRNYKGKVIVMVDTCPNCGTTGPMKLRSEVRCFHFYWIPFFPLRKVVSLQCQHCKKTFKEKDFEPSLKQFSIQLKKEQKYSIFHFTGIILIAGIIFWLFKPESEEYKRAQELSSKQQQHLFQSKLNAPQINDIFFVNVGDTSINKDNYRKSLVLKVIKIHNDTIIFQVSKLFKLDKTLGKKQSARFYLAEKSQDDFFSSENTSSYVIKESRNKIAKKKLLNDLPIHSVERE